MKYVTARDLRAAGPGIWKSLKQEKEMVITLNGRPVAIMGALEGEDPEEYLAQLRRARAMLALERLQMSARASGTDEITGGEIEEEIAAARKGRPR